MFRHKDIHLGTWRSPNGLTVNQIDHICYQGRWASSVQDVRAYRGADVGSDHYLVVATLKIKLKSMASKTMHKILDIGKLRKEPIQKQFQLQLSNRFSALEHQENTEKDVEEEWKIINDTIISTARK